jgi:uncharacterized protein (DUF2062 family)
VAARAGDRAALGPLPVTLPSRLVALLRTGLVEPVVALLLQGLSPEKIALTLAVGLCIAVFPVFGMTTILCTAAAVAFRLNLPLIQAVNLFSAPLQIAFMVPFIRLGEALSGRPSLRMPLARIVTTVTTKPLFALSTLWETTLWAVLAWGLTVPAAGLSIYLILRPVLRTAAAKLRRPPSGADAA